MKTILFFTALIIQLQGLSQSKIPGRVLDSETNEPIIFVTIYINGTSNGTISDQNGNFILENIIPPCEIVFSHIGYQIATVFFNKTTELEEIFLTPRSIEIDDINVNGKNLRKEFLKHFKKQFLGNDHWGKNAYIENDSVLFFHRDYSIPNKSGNDKISSDKTNSVSFKFIAEATEPLIIALPLLGYKLYMDLIKYNELYNPETEAYILDFLGYYYFKSIHTDSKIKSRRIEKHRLKAFYNSSLHFCRSLFENRLKENGYLIKAWLPDEITGNGEWVNAEIDSFLYYSGNELKIIGLKDTSFLINYFHNNKDYPIDITDKIGLNPVNSEIYFLNDTCIIYNKGIVPNNSIVFGPYLGNKRIGASLPDSFDPIQLNIE